MVVSSELLGKVFAVYFAFWSVVLIALFVFVGILIKRHDAQRGKHGHGGSH